MSAYTQAAELFEELRRLSQKHKIVITMPVQVPKERDRPFDPTMVIHLPKAPADRKVVFTAIKSRATSPQAFTISLSEPIWLQRIAPYID